MGTNHFEEIEQLPLPASDEVAPNSKKTKWAVSEETHDKIRKAQRVKRKKDKVELEYEPACSLLGLPLKQFQVFELSDKHKLNALCSDFENWHKQSQKSETSKPEDLIVPFLLFWQQFYFAVVSPQNVNLTGKEKPDCPFNKMPLKHSGAILYIQGHTALDSLLFDSEALNKETGHDDKYQVHFTQMRVNPLFQEFLESR